MEIQKRVYVDNSSYLKLTESNINRVTNGHTDDGFVIISACRSKENLSDELGVELNDQQVIDENNKRTKNLIAKLKSRGYSHIKALGWYHEVGSSESTYEKSFVVYPYDRINKESKDWETFLYDMLYLCRFYYQDSIAVQFPNGTVKLLNQDGDVDMEFGKMSIDNIASEYFTALKTKGNHRFVFEGIYAPIGNNIIGCLARETLNEFFYNPYKK